MNPLTIAPADEAGDEISKVIETLLAAEQRLEVLTAGEVDTVSSRDGPTFLLRRAQEQSRHNEAARRTAMLAELRVLIDIMPAMVWLKDTDNRILRVNRRAAEDIGKSVEDLEGKSMGDFYPDDAAKYFVDDQEVIRSGKPKLGIIETIRNGEGEALWIQTDKVPVCDKEGKVVRIVVMAQDITGRKRADDNVQRLAAIVESSADAIISKTLNGIITSWNPAAEKMFGYKASEIIGQPLLVLLPADRAKEEVEILAGFARGELVRHFETVRLRKGGQTFEVSVTISPIKDADGKIIGASKIVRDITERKRAAALLAESGQRLALAKESAGIGIWEWDVKSDKLLWDAQMYVLYGIREQDFSGAYHAWQNGVHPEDRKRSEAELLAAVAGVNGFHTEFRVVWPGGEVRHIEAHAAMYGADGGTSNRMIGVNWDITERKRLEEQFRQSQKMECFGQLAGGVAHDFNNILAVIQMQLELFKDDRRLTPEQVDCVHEIDVSTERAAALTRQLLLFSRKEILQLRDLDLNQSVNGITNMLRRILGADIEVQFRFSLQLMGIHADSGMMDQVLMNLAVNSRDAMPRGGQLIIETSALTFDQTSNPPPAQGRPGTFVCLTVSDNGCGIPAANLSRIFEPFFTTKPTGNGTGLGLATLLGIVQLHKGWVNVESEVGRGTTFRIYLPRVDKLLPAPQMPEQPKLSSLPGGNETILFVEDDDFLRPSVCNTLSRLGYHVIPVSNGIKALEIWQVRREDIQMLITDLVMPGGITGKQLAERLLKQNPKLKVLYASGYSAETAGTDFPLREGVNFLTKPFHSQKLAKAIRNILDQGSIA